MQYVLPSSIKSSIPFPGLIYIVGGMSELGVELRTLESYNPVTKEWRQLARMATPRAYVGVAVLDDCIYAVGGWNETRRALRTVERYSIEEVCTFFSGTHKPGD